MVSNHVFTPNPRALERCAYSSSPNTICGRLKSDHDLWPLNMRHAEWCPLAEHPFDSVPRDASRAVQPCNCGDQQSQNSYDLGYTEGQLQHLDADIRARGWVVGVHNDYPLHGEQRTFWLYTHPGTGRFVKGEGRTNAAALDQVREQIEAMPDVVCLVGSTRFYRAFQEANYRLSLEGKIVLSLGFTPSDLDAPHWESNGITPTQKAALDELHLRKVELADEVHVLNCQQYIGESTEREIKHALRLGKRVTFRERPSDPWRWLTELGGSHKVAVTFTEPELPHRAENCWCAQLPPANRAQHHHVIITGVDPSSGGDWTSIIHTQGCRKGRVHRVPCDPPEAAMCGIDHVHGGRESCRAGVSGAGLPELLTALGVEQYTPVSCPDCQLVRASSNLAYCPEHDPATPRRTGQSVVERIQESDRA